MGSENVSFSFHFQVVYCWYIEIQLILLYCSFILQLAKLFALIVWHVVCVYVFFRIFCIFLSSANRDRFTFSFPIRCLSFLFLAWLSQLESLVQYWIKVTRVDILVLFLILERKLSSLSPLSVILAVGFL